MGVIRSIVLILNFSALQLFLFTILVLCGVQLTKKGVFLVESEFGYKEEEVRVFQFNPRSEESSVGFATILLAEPFEYNFHKTTDENLVLFSKFGTTEYICTGSCHCSCGERRATSSSVIPRSLIFLVASVTSYIAFDEAKEYFREECKRILSDDCSLSMVQSDVDFCEEIDLESEEDDDVDDDDVDFRVFVCKGNCTERKFYKEKTIELAKNFRCDQLKIEGKIEIKTTRNQEKKNAVAIRLFQNQQLVPFCKEKSKTKYWWSYGKRGYHKIVSLCVGGGDRNRGINSSIHCRQIFPRYKKGYRKTAKTNMKYW